MVKRSAHGGRLRIALGDRKFRNPHRTQPTSKLRPIAVYFDQPLPLDSGYTAVSLLIRLASCQSPLHRLNETESCRLIGRCFFPTQPPTSISLLAFSNVPTPFLCSLLQGSRSQVRQFDVDHKVMPRH
jgi:hypothetical protein